MKRIMLAVLVALVFSACSTTPPGGPDVAPICKKGCYEN